MRLGELIERLSDLRDELNCEIETDADDVEVRLAFQPNGSLVGAIQSAAGVMRNVDLGAPAELAVVDGDTSQK